MTVVAGVDFGTQSVRFSIFDSNRGRLGAGIAEYPVLRRSADPHYVAQHPADHFSALQSAAAQALAQARIDGHEIAALGIDTTGSTVVPLGENLEPLDDFYLWCDHRGWREAEQITAAAKHASLPALKWCGGTYSAEFGWSKLWHWLKANPHLRSHFVTAAEHCDYATAVLCGIRDPAKIPRSICAMGHKWLWNEAAGGLPGNEFWQSLDPTLAGIRDSLAGVYARSHQIAGGLCAEWAQMLGLREGIPIPVAAFDAHWDAIGAGIREGDVVNVIGTSTCVMAISPALAPIPGVFGVVPGSIHPSFAGIEAGLSAAGDIFEAIARRAGQPLAQLAQSLESYRSGQTGLLRLVWDHGDRTILASPHLTGVTLGWTLNHTAADELFAAIEGTAFHTRIILNRLAEYQVPIKRVIHAGGIPRRSRIINQVYANALNLPILLPLGDTTSLGSAIFAFLAAGAFHSVEEAQAALCPRYEAIEPQTSGVAACQELFPVFETLYQALGQPDSPAIPLGHILPQLRQTAHKV